MRNFVFLHIQKTGGTSVFVSLRTVYGDLIYRDMSYRKGKVNGLGVLSSTTETNYPRGFNPYHHRILMGHFTRAKWEHLEWPFVTFLRNPVDRVLSRYRIYWAHRESEQYSLEWFCQKTANFQHWVTGGNIERYAWVGLTERFEESMLGMQAVTGVKYKPKVKANVTPKWRKVPHDFTDKDRRLVESYNVLDMELYKRAVDSFDRRLEWALNLKNDL